MQYFMLLLLVLGLFCLILMIHLIKKKVRAIKIFACAAFGVLIAAVFVWYLSPARYHLEEDVNVTIIYTEKDIVIDSGQNNELKALIDNLYYRRQFFNGYEHLTFQNDEYVYVLVTGVTAEQFPIGLHMTLNEEGFTHGKGYCFDNNYAKIINPDMLIQYVKSTIQST
ncbi:MAG: hypothetical protein ACERKO_02380 [Acetanaerobacterium sp.]